jgi:hypothetical protein
MANENKSGKSQIVDDVSIAASLGIANEAAHEIRLNPAKEANADVLEGAKNHIGVENTGHGYYAEVHHTATYNLNAAEAGFDIHATRFDSYERGSPDIGDDAGGLYNLKFCATPFKTLKAALDKPEYAGQILVAPSDQIQDIELIKERLYQQALANGDSEYAHRIESLQVSESVGVHDGVTSSPLTYNGSQNEAEFVRNGGTPEFADAYGLDDLGERSLEAAGISLAVSLLPEIQSAMQGKKSITEVARGFGSALQKRGLKVGGEAFIKAGFSGELAGQLGNVLESSEQLDSTGAVLVVTLSIEIGKHALALKNGEIDLAEFKQLSKKTIISKGGTILLTAGAVALLGPVGYLTPIIVGQLVANEKIRGQVISSLEGAFSEAEALIRNQIRINEKSNLTLSYVQNTNAAVNRTSSYAQENVAVAGNISERLKDELSKQEDIRQRLLINRLSQKSEG